MVVLFGRKNRGRVIGGFLGAAVSLRFFRVGVIKVLFSPLAPAIDPSLSWVCLWVTLPSVATAAAVVLPETGWG